MRGRGGQRCGEMRERGEMRRRDRDARAGMVAGWDRDARAATGGELQAERSINRRFLAKQGRTNVAFRIFQAML